MKNYIVLLFALISTIGVSAQTKSKYEVQVKAVQTATVQKKVDALSPYLAEGYTIAGIPKGAEKMALPQILQQLGAITAYRILSETKEAKGTRLTISYKVAQEDIKGTLLLNATGKITELNILDSLVEPK